MKKTKKLKIGVVIVLLLAVGLFFHHTLPRTVVVQITGTDVKRVDKTGKVVDNLNDTAGSKGKVAQTYDVRFINSLTRKGKPMVFRNEDTGWGWPPYFKFSSADLTAEAQAFASAQNKPWVLVKYYGWRIQIVSMFPNATSLKEVRHDYSHVPVFNIVFFIVLIGVAFYLRRKVKKLMDRAGGRKATAKEKGE